MVPTAYYVGVSAVLFVIGVLGVLIRRDPLVIFMSIEIMLNAANLALVAFGQRHGSVDGQALVFFVLCVAAAEVAVGLAIIVAIFRLRRRLSVDELSLMRGERHGANEGRASQRPARHGAGPAASHPDAADPTLRREGRRDVCHGQD